MREWKEREADLVHLLNSLHFHTEGCPQKSKEVIRESLWGTKDHGKVEQKDLLQEEEQFGFRGEKENSKSNDGARLQVPRAVCSSVSELPRK